MSIRRFLDEYEAKKSGYSFDEISETGQPAVMEFEGQGRLLETENESEVIPKEDEESDKSLKRILESHPVAGFDIALNLADDHSSVFDLPSSKHVFVLQSGLIYWEAPDRIRLLGTGSHVPNDDRLRAAFSSSTQPELAVSSTALDVKTGIRVRVPDKPLSKRLKSSGYDTLFARVDESNSVVDSTWNDGLEELAYCDQLRSDLDPGSDNSWTPEQIKLITHPLLPRLAEQNGIDIPPHVKWDDDTFDTERELYLPLSGIVDGLVPHESRDLVDSQVVSAFLEQFNLAARNNRNITILPHVLSDRLSLNDIKTLAREILPEENSDIAMERTETRFIIGITQTGNLFTAFSIFGAPHSQQRFFDVGVDDQDEIKRVMSRVTEVFFGTGAKWRCYPHSDVSLLALLFTPRFILLDASLCLNPS